MESYKTWTWRQWLVVACLGIFWINMFTNSYAIIYGLRFRFTLLTLVSAVAISIACLYITGVFGEQDAKEYGKYIAIPIALPILSLIFVLLLSRAVKVNINWIGYLRYLITYGMTAGALVYTVDRDQFKLVEWTEEEEELYLGGQ